ncbi:MAG: HYR domain-containing protein [Saprospiraceae bacterium]|nr:HYR domain-containing protein [Saprospiraceae bacterium]
MRPSTRSAASVQSGMRPAHAFFEKLRPRRGFLLWALLPLLGMLASHGAQAQCTLVCNGASQANPNQVAINQNCEVTLVPDVILESPQSCPGDKILTVRDNANAVIVRDTNIVTFDASAYVDQVLSVTVQDIATTIFCVGFIRTVDNLDPQIICENKIVTCFDSIQPQVLGYPDVSDNCDSEVVLSFLEEVEEQDCLSPNVRVITRFWTATDNSGNTAECIQTITVARPSLDSIQFPADTLLSCENAVVTPAVTGQPTLFGNPVSSGELCDFIMTVSEDTIPLCSSIEFQYLRIWTILDQCSGFSVADTQSIVIQDTLGPKIELPANITVSALPGQCHATVTLPDPISVRDTCDNTPEYFISTSYGAVGPGPHPLVPVGQHTIQYTAIDTCGNTSLKTLTLNVLDSQPPTAVCNEALNVAIPSLGIGRVFAQAFNEGSSDNCAQTVYVKVRRADIGMCNGQGGDDSPTIIGFQEWFDDDVYFCCEDVNATSTLVHLRVYEINPGPGPVDPARELPGGDLFGHFTQCISQVTVQDQLPPMFVDCPENETISCTYDYSDLSVFGSPSVIENCGLVTLDSMETIAVNECGFGTITRTFIATDGSGNIATCMQTITVTNELPLGENEIDWPDNYTTDICGASTDPDDLPEGFDVPAISEVGCGNISYTFQDDLFTTSYPSCYRILRKWTVIDWCFYDPNNPDIGRYTYTQTIKVEDNDAPVVNCPANITVAVNAGCTTAAVTIPPVTGSDCTANLLISNDSPHANSSGANASGNYPLGTTVVKYNVSDRCGNVTTCSVTITVKDNTPPAPVCIVGLSVNLANTNGQIQASINAAAFNGGTSDNCTSASQLSYKIRRVGDTAPPAASLHFTCDDLGTQPVEFWATDEQGNSAYCVTYLAVQDNNEICPFNTPTAMIAGSITTEGGEEVEAVEVVMSGGNSQQSMTGGDGFYQFNGIAAGLDYTVLPQRNNDPLNGVSTIDLILISKHILGIQKLNSPYKIIAADADRSGSISTLDIIILRRLILGLIDQFPGNSTSWRFVRANFTFPNPLNPFAGFFPELYNLNDLNSNMTNADFIAIKIGDVNASAIPNSFMELDQRADNGALTIKTLNLPVATGETFTVEIWADDMSRITGYQFGLAFDPEKLDFVSATTGDLPNMSADGNFGNAPGVVTTSWNDNTENTATGRQVLFQLSFVAKTSGMLKDLLKISPDRIRAESYATDGATMSVVMDFVENPSANETAQAIPELYQNRPNPFDQSTTIAFYLPQSGEARLAVFDMAGKAVYDHTAFYDKGYHEILIDRTDLIASGVYYYQLEVGGLKTTKKMVFAER